MKVQNNYINQCKGPVIIFQPEIHVHIQVNKPEIRKPIMKKRTPFINILKKWFNFIFLFVQGIIQTFIIIYGK